MMANSGPFRAEQKTPRNVSCGVGVGHVSLMTSSHDKLCSAMLSCSPSTSRPRRIGFMVRSLRLSQVCERVRLLRCSHVKRVLTNSVTLNEEQGGGRT